MISTVAVFILAATPAGDGCYAELRGYDAKGVRQAVRIVDVRSTSAKERAVNLLKHEGGVFRLEVNPLRPDRLYFSGLNHPGTDLRVHLLNRAGKLRVETIHLLVCQSQISVSVSEDASWADINFTSVTGELRGCAFWDDWWIRAFPMFGGQEGVVLQGTVIEGKFVIPGLRVGVRHVVVVGRNSSPLIVLAADIAISDKPNRMEIMDLSKYCAAESVK